MINFHRHHRTRKTHFVNFGRRCRHVRRSVLAQLTQDTPSFSAFAGIVSRAATMLRL